MATITLTVPNDKVTRFLQSTNYKATIKNAEGVNIPNPITASVHSKNWILEMVKRQILIHEAEVAGLNASQTAMNQDLSDIS